jgi:hypothetical protein
MADHQCKVEGCLCQTTTQPITEAVYGKKPKKRAKTAQYEPTSGGIPVWRRISDASMEKLADRYPRARRFAARRK